MLEEVGASVNLASNGQIAIDMLRQQEYDLVLMDIQMPVMDGITATQLIKKEFKNPPPVFGLSANAMEGDAEKYIAMGMDDYLAKPLDPEVLFFKIKHWLPEKTKEPVSSENSKTPTTIASGEELLNSSLHQKLLQMAGGNTAHINMLFDSFVADMQELGEQMHKALHERDTAQLRSALHTAKGLSGTIGATALHELCKSLYIKTSELPEVDEGLSAQMEYFDYLLKLTSEQMKI
jgi:CheY-like chemotaxis protein/HPt (histidine-containing phosphotransfer) domain-containing protein